MSEDKKYGEMRKKNVKVGVKSKKCCKFARRKEKEAHETDCDD